MRIQIRDAVNKLLRPLGLRMVSTRWGPRGPWDALRRAAAQGVIPNQIVDVGASNGIWTRECLRIFPNSRYFLVDPLPANAAALQHLAAEYPNVSLWSGALGSEAGSLELYSHGDQSSFLRSDSYPTPDMLHVQVRTLDSFLDDGLLQPPQFIKADVQGFELEVLRGAQRCLQSTQLLLLEVSYRRIYEGLPLAHEVIAAVGEWGFRICDICTYVIRPRDTALVQSDILFAAESCSIFSDESM